MKRYVLNNKRKWFSLPRLAYEIFNNTEIPKDKVIRHLCHNKHCINPYHLKPGTRSENKQDESYISRYMYNLTEKQVYEIRNKYNPQDFNCLERLADEYKVDPKTIWYTVKYKIYKNI